MIRSKNGILVDEPSFFNSIRELGGTISLLQSDILITFELCGGGMELTGKPRIPELVQGTD